MPVYIIHGFRWPRNGFTGVRVHIIVNNLEDACAEYIQTPDSQRQIIESFQKAHPQIMAALPKEGLGLSFIEQHDPEDLTSENAVSQPYAYVADKVVTMADTNDTASRPITPDPSRESKGIVATSALSLNVEDVIGEGSGLSAKGWDAFADLRDAIAPGEKIGWWIVYNGDPERGYEGITDEEDYDELDEEDEDEVEEGSIAQAMAQKAAQKAAAAEKKDQSKDLAVAQAVADNKQEPPATARRRGPPLSLRPKPKAKVTPLEDQKSPLRDGPKEKMSSNNLREQIPNKKLPPIPPPKPATKEKTPQRPKTPTKPAALTKKLFGKRDKAPS